MNVLYPPIKTETKINQFKIEVSQLILFESVSINVLLFDQYDRFIKVKMIRLEGDDYKAWSNDDKYIIDYVKKVLQEESQNQTNN